MLVVDTTEVLVLAAVGESESVRLQLRNACTSGPELTLSELSLSEPDLGFTVLSALDELSLEPGSTASLTLAFTPEVEGLSVGDLLLHSNDPHLPEVQVELIGLTTGEAEMVSGAAPNAAGGSDQTASVGSLVTLDGSASSDPEGDALTYSWSFKSVPSGSALATSDITDRTSVQASFTPDVGGSYRVRFVVSDGTSVDKDFLWVTASSASNSAPTAEAGATVFANTGSVATVDASGSSDPEGDALSYSWTFRSVPASSSITNSSYTDSAAVSTTFTPDVAGDYRVRLIVNDGSLSDKDFVWVRVTGSNSAPTADAGTAQSGAVGAVHTLDGSGSSDPDGDAITYSWSWRTLPAGSSLTNGDITDSTTATPSFTSDVAGTYRLRLVVRDATYTGKDFVNVVVSATSTVGAGASASGETGTHAPNFLLGQQLTVSSAMTLSGLGIELASGSGNVVMALYDDDSGAPGDLVAQTGSEPASSGSNSLALSGGEVSLAAGDYWLMKVHDDVAYVTEDSGSASTETAWTSLTYSASVPDPAGSVDTLDDHLMALWLIGY